MTSSKLTIEEVHQKYALGELSLVEWNELFINEIQKHEKEIGAWEYLDTRLWMEKLERVLEQQKPAFNSLLGVPVGIKDIFNTIDMPTSMGSPIWKGFTPGNDARAVHDIKFNGGITAGKTVTAEFAVHTPNDTRNPWDLRKSPGTSSSGSAAAVASGMIPLALGTQTAGSIIRPASYCGVFGYKPSFGTIARTGMLKTTDSLDTVGLFGTNIDDCRVLFDAIRMKGMDYPIVHQKLNDTALQNRAGEKWKVGILNNQHPATAGYERFATDSFNALAGALSQSASVEISYPQFPELMKEAHSIQEIIYHKSLAYYFKKEFLNKTLISGVMYDIITEGNKISVEQYQAALQQQNELSRKIDMLFEGIDVLLTLSTAGTAPDFNTAIDPPDTCLIWTMCGCPTVNIPLFEHNGLPFGLQAIGRKYSDYKLINFIKEITAEGLFPKFSSVPEQVMSRSGL